MITTAETAGAVRGAADELAVAEGCWFDPAEGQRVVRFVETFCHQSKGRWAGRKLELMSWQRDFVQRLFGWRRADGRRRYRQFYLEVGKKNGKTTLLAALQLLLLVADDDGPEIYINACDRSQASLMFDESARMVRSSPELARRLEVIDSRKVITYPARSGVIRANSCEAPAKDGLNALAAFFDELHRQPDREMWDIFRYAGAAREEPILGSITTAGESEEGIWYDQREYSEGVNEGTIADSAHLGIVYRARDGDDLEDPRTWRQANPSLGLTITEADFARDLAEAKRHPLALANFLRLRLNLITASAAKYFDLSAWDRCAQTAAVVGAAREEGRGRGLPAAYLGLDLANTSDLAALCVLSASGTGWHLTSRFYCPAERIGQLERATRQPYRAWVAAGHLTATPGQVIDYAFVRADVNACLRGLEVRLVLMDPWNATQLAIQLREQDGLPVEFIRQGYLSLSQPTKELRRLIESGQITHDGNPVMRWCLGNAIAIQDEAGNVKLSRKKGREKIDGAVAAVNAVAGTLKAPDPGPSVYQERGALWF